MRLSILIIIFLNSLFSMTLLECTKSALRFSGSAKTLQEDLILKKVAVDEIKHRYEFALKPSISSSVDEDNQNMNLALSGVKRDRFGGDLKGSIDYKRSLSSSDDVVGSLSYTFPLFRKFGKKYNSLDEINTKESFELFKFGLKDKQASIIIKATQLYFDYILSEKKQEIFKKSLQGYENSFNASKAKQKAGIVSKMDVYRAKLALLKEKRSYKKEKKDLIKKRNALFRFINTKDNKDKFSLLLPSVDVKLVDVSLDEILKNSLKFKELKIKEERIKRELFKAKREYFPDLKLTLKVDTNGGCGVILSSSYDIDRFSTDKKIQKNMIELNRVKRELMLLKDEIRDEKEELLENFKNLKYELKIRELEKESSFKSLEVAKIRFERGVANNEDLLNAQKSYTQAKVELFRVKMQIFLSYLDVLKFYGKLDEKSFSRLVRK